MAIEKHHGIGIRRSKRNGVIVAIVISESDAVIIMAGVAAKIVSCNLALENKHGENGISVSLLRRRHEK